MESADGLRLLTKVARLYHARGLRQAEIGARLHLSQPRVSRLLAQAQERGIVRRVVAAPAGLHSDLEDELERGYRLQAAHVVDTLATDDAELTRDLGTAAAPLVAATLSGAGTVGFTSWSRTMQHLVEALQPLVPGARRIVEMLGDLGPPRLQHDTAHLTQRLAALTGGQPTFLRIPGVVETAEIGRALLHDDPHARAALHLLDDLDVTLMSVGPSAVVAPLVAGDNYFTHAQFADARHRGAVGQICLRFLDANGAPVATPLDDLVIGVTFDQLRTARNRWLVAGGADKHAAVRAALVGGWVDRLVVDTATAEHLIDEVEAARTSEPERGSGGVRVGTSEP